jgi:hypothetical protein
VIDGVVHKQTAEPSYAVVETCCLTSYDASAGWRIELVWRLGDLAMTDNQGTVVAHSERRALPDGGLENGIVKNQFPSYGDLPPPDTAPAIGLSFPAAGFGRAKALFDAWSDHRHIARRAGPDGGSGLIAMDPPAETDDPTETFAAVGHYAALLAASPPARTAPSVASLQAAAVEAAEAVRTGDADTARLATLFEDAMNDIERQTSGSRHLRFLAALLRVGRDVLDAARTPSDAAADEAALSSLGGP